MLALTLSAMAVIVLALVAHFTGARVYSEDGVVARALASRAIVALVFVITFVVLWYAWAAWNPIPVVHDEMAYVLQAQIYAKGHWSLPSPPLPLFWEQPHVLTEPRLAAKYFPGHPLLMALGALVGWIALMPLALNALSGALMFVLARRIAGGAVAVTTWMVWLFTPMVLYYGPSYFSEATTTVCWLAGWYALLEWRTTRHRRWLLLVALFTGWDAIARPLTGVAYAIPIAVVVLRDVIRERRWKDFAVAFAVGACVIALVPLWSAFTTGDWTVTPLALYTRNYMPYDVPGFGINTAVPAHSITPDLVQLNNVYSSVHVNHFPRTLLSTLGERAMYLAVSIWGSTGGLLGIFAIIGVMTLTVESAFALVTGIVLLLTYLVFATPAQWTLYYYESVPAYTFVTASGMAYAASLIGRPHGMAMNESMRWTSGRWRRALLTTSLCLLLPGFVALRLIHALHISDRRHLVPFYRLLASIPDRKAIMFVRYAGTHSPHVTFVRNTANLAEERIWVVYDRGEKENGRLLSTVPDRKAYLFDELNRRTYHYSPLAH